MKKPKVAIIVPTIRENSLTDFLKRWEKELTIASKSFDISLYIVEDNPESTFKISSKSLPYKLKHLSWKDIDQSLGKTSWIIPRRTDAVRSFGVYLAYQDNNEFFITLDDDCYPAYNDLNKPGYFVQSHVTAFTQFTSHETAWVNTIKKYKPRGLPYGNMSVDRTIRNVAVSHGLWINVPDFDAITALTTEKKSGFSDHIQDIVIPEGKFFPMCSMNLAWKRDITPLMYFLLMGQDSQGNRYDFDRFGDIWCGLFVKKILDHHQLAAVSGSPYIYHERASNSFENLQKEAAGIKMNETLWRELEKIEFSSLNMKDSYKQLAAKLPQPSQYWEKLAEAMLSWIDLF